MRWILAAALFVGLASVGRANEPCPPKCCGEHARCHSKDRCRDFSLDRLMAWAGYRPHPAPRGDFYLPGPMPPLYTFFLHCWRQPTVMVTPRHWDACRTCR